MNLVDKLVRHKDFGEGCVVECTETFIEVSFPVGNKKFLFPDALGTHLTLVDREAADRARDVLEDIKEKRREEELEQQAEKLQEYEREQRFAELKKLWKNHKLSPASQVVFWLEPEEQEKVFTEWEVFTGMRQSGPNAGKPNRLVRLHQNSACLISEREPDEQESARRIVGLFMVDETFVGSECEDGIIPAHSTFRIRLSEEESQKMLFWNYYVNTRYPHSITWNSGRHRYFDNLWMAQILSDIIALKNDPEEKELAKKFFEHFCHMNQLDGENLPKPQGALLLESATSV